jgi:hypothetical protein
MASLSEIINVGMEGEVKGKEEVEAEVEVKGKAEGEVKGKVPPRRRVGSIDQDVAAACF